MFLIYHLILQDHVVKGSAILWLEAPCGKSPSCQKLMAIDIVIVEI